MATCREKLKIDHPTAIGLDPSDPVFRGGCRGCPDDYGYLDPPRFCNDPRLDPMEKCTKCWDREIPEPGIGMQLVHCAFCSNYLIKRPSNPLPDGWTHDLANFKCPECNEKEKEKMSTTNNLNVQPDYEAQCKALTDRCCSLERTIKALEIENKGLETYIETLEARLAKHEIVVKCVEALTGEKLGIE